MILTLCNSLFIAGLMLLILGAGGVVAFRIPKLGIMGAAPGLLLIVLSLLLQILGFCS